MTANLASIAPQSNYVSYVWLTSRSSVLPQCPLALPTTTHKQISHSPPALRSICRGSGQHIAVPPWQHRVFLYPTHLQGIWWPDGELPGCPGLLHSQVKKKNQAVKFSRPGGWSAHHLDLTTRASGCWFLWTHCSLREVVEGKIKVDKSSNPSTSDLCHNSHGNTTTHHLQKAFCGTTTSINTHPILIASWESSRYRWGNCTKIQIKVMIWILKVPQMPGIEGLVINPWCYWEMVQSLRHAPY
jgi:hypothetical protein